jgi:hypothetical protein
MIACYCKARALAWHARDFSAQAGRVKLPKLQNDPYQRQRVLATQLQKLVKTGNAQAAQGQGGSRELQGDGEDTPQEPPQDEGGAQTDRARDESDAEGGRGEEMEMDSDVWRNLKKTTNRNPGTFYFRAKQAAAARRVFADAPTTRPARSLVS